MVERLKEYYEAAAHETDARIRTTSEAELYDLAAENNVNQRSFSDRIDKFPGVGVIAEFKQASPSLGEINNDWNVRAATKAYLGGGAVAMSILTLNHGFSGAIDFIRQAREESGEIPILQKDFISDPYQILEAAAYGADASLLIVGGIDDDGKLRELYDYANELGLDSLVEVHDLYEMERALALDPKIIGINNRDLTHPKMPTNIGTFDLLAGRIPADSLAIAESGYEVSQSHKSQIVHHCGNAVLMGTALMQHADPEQAIKTWNSF